MHVKAKPEEVLSFRVDSQANPPGMSMEAGYQSPVALGNSYEWTFKMLGMLRKGVTVCTDYVPSERVAFRNIGALEGTSTWTVEPEDGGSKATAHAEARLAIPLVGRFFDPFLRKEWERNHAGDCVNWRSIRRSRIRWPSRATSTEAWCGL